MLTPFKAKLVDTARNELNQFGGHNEADPVLSARIETYWTGLGLHFPDVDTPWSAVFVSWCVKQAGATAAEFAFSPMHSVFVHAAIKNQKAGVGVFRAVPIDAVAPEPGFIIHWNRPGGAVTYDQAAVNGSYPSHSAIVVAVGADAHGPFAHTIGGNEADTVGRTRVPLDANGRIVPRTKMPYISVIQALK